MTPKPYREWWLTGNSTMEIGTFLDRSYHPGMDLNAFTHVVEASALREAEAEIAVLKRNNSSAVELCNKQAAEIERLNQVIKEGREANEELRKGAREWMNGKTISLEEEIERLKKSMSEASYDPEYVYNKIEQQSALLDKAVAALEKIATHEQTSIDKVYLIHQCEGYRAVAKQALEEIKKARGGV